MAYARARSPALIKEKGLTSLDDVRAHTKASASCGSCTGLVEQLMTLTLGDAYNPAAVQPMCACTSLGHDDVRRLIKAKGLKTIHAVMQELEWKTSCGCAKCRPALNYYLICDWPGEYADDYQSRFINERAHANIQKDGTYSVVPRMWGGVTSAKELRAIADVVDKFAIPAVKVTGGQRIDMLGIKKEDLPAVWADLGEAGFVSGHAYAKGLRTVKTCVGTDWCRFGTQDSTGFGVRIEKFMWGSWTPAKVKMAVSGCPRNCAEATCKDVGVVCVDSGYEIHFAGAAGLDIKGTEVLGLVKTEDEALEVIVALVQMYREQARYLERIYKWTKRIGVAEIRRQVLDDVPRRARRSSSASSSRRSLPRSIHGRSASPACTSMSSGRWPRSAWHRRRSERDELDCHRHHHGHSAARRALRRHAGRQGRRVPHRRRSRVRHRRPLPAQGRSAQPGHRARRLGHVPAAQLGHLAGKRQGAGRRRGLRAHDPGQGRGRHALHRAQRASRTRGLSMDMAAPRCIKTTCPYCGVGCGVLAEVSRQRRRRGARRSRASGQFRTPVLEGRGAGGDASTSTTGCCFREVHGVRSDWDSALDLVAGKFNEAIRMHGPDSVAFYVSGQLLTEDYYVANKLMKGFIGSANIDTNSRLCMASSVAGHKRAFGSDTVPGCYEDLELADLVVLVGSNLAWCHPVLYQRIAAAKEKRPGMKVVLIDPRRTATADIADLHLPIKPDGDVPLFLGLLRYLARTLLDQAQLHQAAHDRLQGGAARAADALDLYALVRLHGAVRPRCWRSSSPCSPRRRRPSPSTARASTNRRPAPTRSTPSSTAIWPPAASASRAWGRSPSPASPTPWAAARSAASPTCSRRT